eukprot:GILJ01004865.1.p2 GENE.GILJ01004865.1~~GILJ01004865.1.p2  ORF type:complete len:462 (-),score=83.78 GILJ01004865.1:1715-2953(-)
MDNFYKGLTPEQKAEAADYNFDHPSAFDIELLAKVLADLREGKEVEIPIYDFKTHGRLEETLKVKGGDVIIFEGILSLYWQELRDLMDLKIFVHTDDDIRLSRRLLRDTVERARDVSSVLQQYMKFVKPAYDEYIRPSMKFADIIVPQGLTNTVAIDLIVQHIRLKINQRARLLRSNSFESSLALSPPNQSRTGPEIDEFLLDDNGANVTDSTATGVKSLVRTLPHSTESAALLSILADHAVLSREALVMYVDRAAYLAATFVLNEITPLVDKQFSIVSTIGMGEILETGTRNVLKDLGFGRLLVQHQNNEPSQVIYSQLGSDLSTKAILILEPFVFALDRFSAILEFLGSSHADSTTIYVLCLFASTRGVLAVNSHFPSVKFISCFSDSMLSADAKQNLQNIVPKYLNLKG